MADKERKPKRMSDMGWLGKAIAIAGASALTVALGTAVYGIIVGYPGLVKKVSAQETTIEDVEKKQAVISKNQHTMDESLRDLQADSEWSQLKLDALLDNAGITKRIPRPKLKKSELEELDE